MERQARIAVVGSCNVDLTVFTPVVPRGGETVLGSEFQMNVGGKGTNQATAARRAGGAVCMITRVGEDFLAGVALAHYRSEGISTAHVRETAAAATGTRRSDAARSAKTRSEGSSTTPRCARCRFIWRRRRRTSAATRRRSHGCTRRKNERCKVLTVLIIGLHR